MSRHDPGISRRGESPPEELLAATHYVLVVGVTPRSFCYRDSLTGTAMYHDFRIMNALIGDVYYVELREVEKLFAAELRVCSDE